jgi:preprotein translocase subunit SecG
MEMNPMSLKIVLGVSIVVWLLICLLIYERSKSAVWLAGSTVASCLFFLGATVAASFLVKGTLFLAPLWMGVLILSLLHLRAAQRKTARGELLTASRRWQTSSPASQATGKSESTYI